jgi:PTH2 family peptidyl-tRNA hydrolase
MYKQVIIVRDDIAMSVGKTIAQCCHAAVSAVKKTKKEKFIVWDRHGQKKVVLKVKSLGEMIKIKNKCNKLRITHAMISDAGLTELTPGIITAMAIGPDDEKKIDKVTGSLPLLK